MPWNPGPLRQLQLELVNACNYRCPLCKTLKKDGTVRRRISVDETKRVIEPVADELAHVTLFGTRGEPFLHPQLEEIVTWIKARTQAATEVSTNGSLVTPERARAVLDSGLDRLVFAIDGLTQETYGRYRVGGTLETVLANLAHLCQLKECGDYATKIVFQLIPMAHNEHEIEGLPELAYGLGVDQVRLKVSGSVGRSDALRPAGLDYVPAAVATASDGCFSCPFGLDKLYVDPNGDCFPCCYAEGRRRLKVGNALETSIREVWAGEALRAIREPFSTGGERHSFCVSTCAERRHKKKLKLARPKALR